MPRVPRVSILIPVYNEAPRLPALFRSLARLGRDTEIIMVDDGSTDGSGTLVRRWASIGSGATILANVTIGENAMVGAGSVVTKDVPANSIAAGNPARILRYLGDVRRSDHDRRISRPISRPRQPAS